MKNLFEMEYIDTVSFEHRKMFGQFYTHRNIADFMTSWIMEINPKTICDPAFGLGIFYDACKSHGFTGSFFATEIDTESYNYIIKRKTDSDNLFIKNIDYFTDWNNKYDAILCNPPYLKFQFFYGRDTVINKLRCITGEKISGYTNISSAFLIKSILELDERGRLAYIMPYEFLNTGYGIVIKKILLSYGIVHDIIKINDENGAFNEVLTTVCIILFEKIREYNKRYIKFSTINSVQTMDLSNINLVNSTSINYTDKWLPYFLNNNQLIKLPNSFVPLSNYGYFKRGIATGANDFFTLTRSQIKKIGLLDTEYKLCITKSNQISNLFLTQKDIILLDERDAPIYIFYPLYMCDSQNLFGQQLSEQAKKYIKYGEKNKYNCRYLTKSRKIWFSLEYREPAPILFGVFSRGKFKIIRNETSSVNLTCYHGFFPNTIGFIYIDKLFVFLNSQIGYYSLTTNKRQYGNRLDKFEPSDLNSILVPSIDLFNRIPDSFIQKEMNHLKMIGSISEDGEMQLTSIFNL